MIGRPFVEWMRAEDRTIGYTARQCEMDETRLVDLLVGHADPTNEELLALAEVTGVSVDDLRGAADATPAATAAGPREWFSVREAAEHLGVSEDTIYAMTKAGTLRYAVVGQRLKRIHRQDMERLRTEQPRDERVRRSERSSRRTVSNEPEAPPGRLL